MPSRWDIDYEPASSDTTSSTQTLVPLHWTRATINLRRRAPHIYRIDVPRSSHHRLTDFTAGRELRISRNGAYIAWGGGFMDAPSLSGGKPAERRLTLPGWGNAYILTTRRAFNEAGSAGILYLSGFDADGIIAAQLDDVRHAADDSSGTAWFTAAGRTLGAAATAINNYPTTGKSPLEVINEVVDVEAWAWRAGIDTAGVFTFKASGTVDVDQSATIKCFDGANCEIADFRQDGSQITTTVFIKARYPNLVTRLNGARVIGNISLTVDSSDGFQASDTIVVGEETGAAETRTISTIGGATTINIDALINNHADNETVKLTPNNFRTTDASAATAQRQAHHYQPTVIFNDTLQGAAARAGYATAYIAAYDAPLKVATITTTNQALIDQMLTAGMEPGDSISLTSNDQDLSLFYSATTVKVQEMSLVITPGAVESIALVVGDPIIDDLAVLERKIAAARIAATAYGRGV